MRWARDVVAEHREGLIGSVTSLLIVTTRAMVVGMDADLTAVPQTPLDVVVTGIGSLTISEGDAVSATVISTMTASGVAAGKVLREGCEAPVDTLRTHSHNDLPGILRMWRNWQTRRSQKPVMVTSWRFKSSHPHQ
jgi:hypothetical protein